MSRRLCALAVMTMAWMLPAAASQAATYCVSAPAGCIGIAPTPDKIQSAVADAIATPEDDVIQIDAGTFSNDAFDVPAGANGALVIQGAGTAATILTSSNAAAARPRISAADATVRALQIQIPTALDNSSGLVVSGGIAEDVLVTGTASSTGMTGVTLADGGRLLDSTVTLEAAGSIGVQTAPSGDGAVADSELSACTGVLGHSAGTTTVQRTRVTGSTGFDADAGDLVVDSSTHRFDPTLTCPPNAAVSMRGTATVPRSVRVTNLTAVDDSGAPGTAGIRLRRESGASPMTAVVGSSVFDGVDDTLVRTAATGAPPTVTIRASAIDKVQATAAGYESDALAPNLDTPVVTGFVDRAAGDYRLLHTSELIDVGEAAPAGTLSPTDLAGAVRDLEGKPSVNGPVGRRDIGAFEYVPGLPAVDGTVVPETADTNEIMTFVATGDAGDAGEDLTYAWSFDDGTAADGDVADKAFASAGTHTATVTATDASGWTATDRVTIEVNQAPPPDPPARGGTAATTVNASTAPAAPSTPLVVVPRGSGPLAVAFTRQAAALDRSGRIGVRMECRATTQPCAGTLVLTTARRTGKRTRTVRLGRATFTIAPEEIVTVRVRVNRALRGLVRGTRGLSVRAAAAVTGGRSTQGTIVVRRG